MKNTFRLIFLSLALVATKAVGQVCGTEITPEQEIFMRNISVNYNNSSLRTKAVLVQIPIQFNYIVRDDGTGGLNSSQTEAVLNRLNSYYINSDIQFYMYDEVNIIRSDEYFNFNASFEGAIAVPNDKSRVINIYFFNSLVSGGTPLCGYTRFPPSSDRVFVAYNCVTNGTTLEHEIGHYFTLYHTHGKTNTGTTDELVNGANCTTAGDDLCDTPADPNLTGKVSNCIYTGNDRDANGETYSPQVANIMAYSPDACQNLFTSGQYLRIRNGFENGRNYLIYKTDDFTVDFFANTRSQCIGSSVTFISSSFGATGWRWEFEGGTPSTSTAQQVTVTYNTAGSYNVKLTASTSNGEEAVREKLNYISVRDPLDGALQSNINLNLTSLPDESLVKVENPDNATTFTLASYDADDNPESSCYYVNIYDYFTENPLNLDYLNFTNFNSLGVSRYTVNFDVAYTYRPLEVLGDLIRPNIYDSLEIRSSINCATEGEVIWKSGGNALKTAPASSVEFFPIGPSQWKSISVSKDVTENETFNYFQIISKSYNGNNLFLDNIRIVPDYSVNKPTNFRVGTIRSSSVVLRWLDASVNELGFRIERSVNGEAFEQLATVEKNLLSYEDTAIEFGNTYAYRIVAVGLGENESEPTQPVEVNNFVTDLETDVTGGINIYPNPATDILRISNENPFAVDISLYDANGGEVVINQIILGGQNQQFNLKNLKNGFYIVKVSTNKGNSFYKIVVLK